MCDVTVVFDCRRSDLTILKGATIDLSDEGLSEALLNYPDRTFRQAVKMAVEECIDAEVVSVRSIRRYEQ